MNNPAIIVPYRDRALHLSIFIPAMKAYLPDADILVMEQADDKPFNRAKLFNIGFQFTKFASYFIFHDVDKIPVNVDYSFPSKITQLEKSRFQLNNYFGGVTMFNAADFRAVNGFSNHFWGWGGEDNQMHKEVLSHGLEIEYRNCIFRSLPHKVNGTFDPKKWKQAQMPRSDDDGLTHCEYDFYSKEDHDGYTLIKVEL